MNDRGTQVRVDTDLGDQCLLSYCRILLPLELPVFLPESQSLPFACEIPLFAINCISRSA